MTDREILQLINRPESDRDRVLRLAAKHNADLPGWCARRRRRHHAAVVAVVTALVATSFLTPHRSDTFVSGDLQCCTSQACSRITVIMAKI